MQYHTLQICGLERKLPLIQVGRHSKIAAFSILGDVELTDVLADEMVLKIKNLKLIILSVLKLRQFHWFTELPRDWVTNAL